MPSKTASPFPALATYAVRGDEADALTAREHSEAAHPYRSSFQRDRARIIHSRAFRRLAGKTQVFTRPGDHFRSRLTHTMEVAQISRAIASALHLNEDLAEALALVHDIGHPPFGHSGEQALDACLVEHGLRFDHNLHALRIVEFFEQRYAAFRGLNLTLGVREGIVKHSRDYSLEQHPELAPYMLDRQPPLEAQLIDWADEIAYLTADLDDGFESGILDPEHIREHVPLFGRFHDEMLVKFPNVSQRLRLNEALKGLLNALVDDLIDESSRRVDALDFQSLVDVRRTAQRIVGFSPAMEGERRIAKQYLYRHLYHSEDLAASHNEGAHVIASLFRCWSEHPELLPSSCAAELALDGVPRTVADYLAGMTDAFILTQYEAHRSLCS